MLLCRADEEARVSGRAAAVDILGVLRATLSEDQALHEAPPLIIVSMANIYTEGEE